MSARFKSLRDTATLENAPSSGSIGLCVPNFALRLLVVLPLICAPALHGVLHAQTTSRVDALAEPYAPPKPVSGNLSRLTFYRPANEIGPVAGTVYIEAAYHTSLLKGSYSEACVKPGNIEVGLRGVEDDAEVRNPVEVTTLHVHGGQQHFLRVSDQSGRYMRVQTVTAEMASAELAQTRLQVHTLSRALSVVPCEDGPPVESGQAPK